MSAKYICVDYPMVGDTIIIFPTWVAHKVVADALASPVLSAGFVDFDVKGFPSVWGTSTTLKKQYRPEDARLITRQIIGE